MDIKTLKLTKNEQIGLQFFFKVLVKEISPVHIADKYKYPEYTTQKQGWIIRATVSVKAF